MEGKLSLPNQPENLPQKEVVGKTGIYVNKTAHENMGLAFELFGRDMKSFSPEFITRNPGTENQAMDNDEYIELTQDQANRIYKNIVDHLEKSKISPESFLFRLERLQKYLDTINSENAKKTLEEIALLHKNLQEIVNRTKQLKSEARKKQENNEDFNQELNEIDFLKKQTSELDLSKLKEIDIY